MLSSKKVERTKAPGRYRDGLVKGLLLQVVRRPVKGVTKSWVLRYELHGRERMMGLGPVSVLTLKEARDRATEARKLLLDGIDPLATKHQKLAAAKLAASKVITFREAAEQYSAQHEGKWKNPKYRSAFLSTLKLHVFPLLGDMNIGDIKTNDVLRAIEPIWTTRTVTASRTLTRIEHVLDWATVRGLRTGDNPARWKKRLAEALPSARELAPIKHFAAIEYKQLPAFMGALREREGSAERALEFLILTATRTGEIIGARWGEIDLAAATWTIPAERMKAGKEHRIPLSSAATALLKNLQTEEGNPFIFVGRPGRSISEMALRRVMKSMNRKETVHGFRSAFSDWAHEQSTHSHHTIEISLAHAVGSAVERSYRRGNMLAKRVALMASWAKYCAAPSIGKAGNVTQLRARR